ncbi:MAG: electron transport complex subunit E [Lachnospiraceae bacterium]|nr:electron transport complex subunit E [Lachnospiraceae bacterium]
MKDNKDKPLERIWNGIYVENPVFCLILGMCPTLATTTSATNAIGMGLSTTAILVASNLMISLLKGIIPNRMRIPSYIVIIASFVTIVEFLMEGFFPSVYASLGIYIPLIVVNCIIMGRAEAYAGKKGPVETVFDGLGMGIGFTLALLLIGSVREIVGAGTWFGAKITPAIYEPVNLFILAPGAFLVMAFFVAIMNKLKIGAARRTDWDPTENGCADCSSCAKLGFCGGKPAAAEEEVKA